MEMLFRQQEWLEKERERLSKVKLEKKNIFDHIDKFDIGTLKFSRNQNYIADEKERL